MEKKKVSLVHMQGSFLQGYSPEKRGWESLGTACPSTPLWHQGYRNGLYTLTVQLTIQQNAIKDLSEKGMKRMNLNLNTLLSSQQCCFSSVLEKNTYTWEKKKKKKLITKSLLILIPPSYHLISLILLYILFISFFTNNSTSVDRSWDCAVTFMEGQFYLIYNKHR